MAVYALSSRRLRALLCFCCLFLLHANPCRAEIPGECLDVYVRSGAIPVGPNAGWRELLICESTAAAGPVGLGNYYCTASSGTRWIEEYCGTACNTPGDIYSCFQPPPLSPYTPNTGRPSCPSNPAAGNPIVLANGNKYEEVTDYLEPGRLPLAIKRYYNSAAGEWRFMGQQSLQIAVDQIVWLDDDGKALTFKSNDMGWHITDQASLTLQQLGSGEWLLTNAAQEKNLFDASGRLLSITNLYGESQSYHYSPDGLLILIEHSNGGALTLSYESGELNEIVTSDGDIYLYSYEQNGLLAQVTYPGGATRNYHYENPELPNALTGVTNEKGVRYASWAYDSQGRAVLSEHANQQDNYRLAFNADGTTTATNPLGKQTIYHFVSINGARKVSLVEGQASAHCAAANRAYTYYSEGDELAGLLQSSTDWQGHVTRYQYNSRGLEILRIKAEGTPEERRITTEWHPTLPLKTKITEPSFVTTYEYDTLGHLLKIVRHNSP